MKKLFHTVAFIEGLSYLFLLGIAMPLKYWADLPLFVKYGGWAHGVLFILYMLVLTIIFIKKEIDLDDTIRAGVLAFVPFGWRWVKF
jgi:integral membrane protein